MKNIESPHSTEEKDEAQGDNFPFTHEPVSGMIPHCPPSAFSLLPPCPWGSHFPGKHLQDLLEFGFVSVWCQDQTQGFEQFLKLCVSVGICTDLQIPMKARDIQLLLELELACDCELPSMDAGN